jgi:serine/threonine protein kinase
MTTAQYLGISKFTGDGQSQLTQTGSLLGTPAYMAPEQARGDKGVNYRADIYSMGVILYRMLTGGMPFEAERKQTIAPLIVSRSLRRKKLSLSCRFFWQRPAGIPTSPTCSPFVFDLLTRFE